MVGGLVGEEVVGGGLVVGELVVGGLVGDAAWEREREHRHERC